MTTRWHRKCSYLQAQWNHLRCWQGVLWAAITCHRSNWTSTHLFRFSEPNPCILYIEAYCALRMQVLICVRLSLLRRTTTQLWRANMRCQINHAEKSILRSLWTRTCPIWGRSTWKSARQTCSSIPLTEPKVPRWLLVLFEDHLLCYIRVQYFSCKCMDEQLANDLSMRCMPVRKLFSEWNIKMQPLQLIYLPFDHAAEEGEKNAQIQQDGNSFRKLLLPLASVGKFSQPEFANNFLISIRHILANKDYQEQARKPTRTYMNSFNEHFLYFPSADWSGGLNRRMNLSGVDRDVASHPVRLNACLPYSAQRCFAHLP